MHSRWIICEKSGQWAAALRWASGADAARLRETRSLLDCLQELERWPASFLFLEATVGNSEGVLRLLWNLQNSFPLAQATVLTTRDAMASTGWFREAGAVHVAVSPRRADLLVRLARRHHALLPPSRQSLRETIWTRLPWGES